MIRRLYPPRPNAAERHAEIGFRYHDERSSDGQPYWREGVAYEFTLAEVEAVEAATEELHSLCLALVDDVVTSGDYPNEFGLGDAAKALIERSWKERRAAVYGRFDLLFESTDRIKLYEYNADTPTALLEAAVAQWLWVEEAPVPNHDQFNSIHEKLVERWRQVLRNPGDVLYLFGMKNGWAEDWGNISYMAEVAMQAGWQVTVDDIDNVGYDGEGFVDLEENPIGYAFKLYPWEWMMEEEFGVFVAASATQWFEPPWKLLLSNKAILPLLWAKNPNHPNLLPAFFEETNGFVKKPTLGREGANVYRRGWLMEGSHFATEYDTTYVYQEYAPPPEFDGHHPVIGSWVIGNQAAGMGIREDRTLISGNGSHFVPHYFVEEN
jgi:glutathionylspermidine synthase